MIDENATIHLAADVPEQSRVGPDAHRHHQNVKIHLRAAAHDGFVPPEFGGGISQHQTDALFLQDGLHHTGAFIVQNAGQHSGCQVADRDAFHPAPKTLGTLQPDQTGAYDQHPAVRRDGFFQRQHVVHGHEGAFAGYGIITGNRGNERRRTGGNTEGGIGNLRPIVQRDRFPVGVDAHGAFAVENLTAVFLIEVRLAVVHLLGIGFALQTVGNQRTAVDGIVFFGNHGNGRLGIHTPDSFNTSGGGNAVSDYNILLHALHLSS